MTNMRKRHVYPVLEGKRRPKSAVELAIVERHRQQGHRELYSTSVATSNADADPDADAIIDTPADTSMTASDWSRAEEDTVWDTGMLAGILRVCPAPSLHLILVVSLVCVAIHCIPSLCSKRSWCRERKGYITAKLPTHISGQVTHFPR